jgi:hypothetical protein
MSGRLLRGGTGGSRSGVPWFYNTLTFATARDGIDIRCAISPSYGQFTLRLRLAGQRLLDVDVRCVVGMRVENRPGREALLASVQRQDDFVLQLKPHVYVGWSTGI